MSAFTPGELLDVTIPGVRVIREETDEHGYRDLVVEYADDARAYEILLPAPGASRVTVERIAPAEWPPQPGDVWAPERWRDQLWMAVTDSRGETVLVSADNSSARRRPDEVVADRGRLALLFRPEVGVAETPTEPRTWREGDSIPDDVLAVLDKQDDLWRRQPYGGWRYGGDVTRSTIGLLRDYGPVTEYADGPR